MSKLAHQSTKIEKHELGAAYHQWAYDEDVLMGGAPSRGGGTVAASDSGDETDDSETQVETLRKLLAQTRAEYEKKLADQYARLTGQLTELAEVNDKDEARAEAAEKAAAEAAKRAAAAEEALALEREQREALAKQAPPADAAERAAAAEAAEKALALEREQRETLAKQVEELTASVKAAEDALASQQADGAAAAAADAEALRAELEELRKAGEQELTLLKESKESELAAVAAEKESALATKDEEKAAALAALAAEKDAALAAERERAEQSLKAASDSNAAADMVATLQTEKAALEAELAKAKALETDLEAARAEMADGATKAGQLQARVGELEAELVEAERLRAQAADALAAGASAAALQQSEDLAKLRSEMEEREKDLAALRESLAAREAELAAAQTAAKDLEAERDAVAAEKAALEEALVKAREDLSVEAANAEQASAAAARAAAAKATADEAAEAGEDLATKCQSLSVKLVEVTHERDAKDQFILEKEKWISRLQQTVQTGDTEVSRLKDESKKLKAALIKLQKERTATPAAPVPSPVATDGRASPNSETREAAQNVLGAVAGGPLVEALERQLAAATAAEKEHLRTKDRLLQDLEARDEELAAFKTDGDPIQGGPSALQRERASLVREKQAIEEQRRALDEERDKEASRSRELLKANEQITALNAEMARLRDQLVAAARPSSRPTTPLQHGVMGGTAGMANTQESWTSKGKESLATRHQRLQEELEAIRTRSNAGPGGRLPPVAGSPTAAAAAHHSSSAATIPTVK